MKDEVQFSETVVSRARRGWIVRIPTASGRQLEYEYPTRRSADYHAAIFRMEPSWYPEPTRVREPGGRRRHKSEQRPAHRAVHTDEDLEQALNVALAPS